MSATETTVASMQNARNLPDSPTPRALTRGISGAGALLQRAFRFFFSSKINFLLIERMHDTVIIVFKRSRTTTFCVGGGGILSSRSARGQPQLISSSMKAQCSHEPNFNQLSRETSRNLIQLRNSSAGMIS